MMRRLVALAALMATASCGAQSVTAPEPAREPPLASASAPSTSPPPPDAAVDPPADAAVDALEADAAADGSPTAPDATAAATDARPEIGSLGYITWIYRGASRAGQPIGFIRPGTAVTLASTTAVAGAGCGGARWYAVEPRGFVCADSSTTLNLADPLYAALHQLIPPPDRFPSYRYAYSLGAPMYGRIPSRQEQQAAEREFFPLDKLVRDRKPRSGYEELATSEILHGDDPVPSLFAGGAEAPRMHGFDKGLVRRTIPEGSLMSFVAAFEAEGRTWLLTPDLTLVPSDRVRPFRVTSFHGVEIGGEVQLPLAWTRGTPKPKFRRGDDGKLTESSDTWPPRTVVLLTGQSVQQGALTFLETREPGVFVRDADASVVRVPDPMPTRVADDEKWIDFSIGKGTFTLWVGKTPVFSTLASPGAGSTPPRGNMTNEELVRGSHTPLGIYRIEYKTRTTTMSPEATPNPEKHWIADVGYTQYFRPPFAIHMAYWHEDFGNPKSGGCINLSPQDARRVFEWTAPSVPDEWSGAASYAANGLGTKVVIRR